MDYSTLLDNFVFWGIFLPVFWLVWKSHAPMTFFCCALDTVSTQLCADDAHEVRTPKTLTLKLSCRIYSPF
ncbi:hypothetical protein [uncultured Vibrio sp.]|uniref:hypothetical protein n=1 Tax=uncultured Vibrio sp. TaxID=114054 RepID=UPI0026168415|nr:hypothetical protein [uncultured Vibrio sp.]